MTTEDSRSSPVCQRVWDRLVQGADVSSDAELGEHLGSCMACYRALSELRDAPRIAAMLRADAAATGARDESFWDQLATRTGDAAAAAMARPRKRRPVRLAAVGAVLAAAASWMLFVRAPTSTTNGGAPGVSGAGVALVDDGTPSEEVDLADVAGMDETALRTLLERLRAGAGEAGALAATNAADDADMLDDESELDEVLAELDGPALRRVQRSLAGTTL
jgi:hypothetical protein